MDLYSITLVSRSHNFLGVKSACESLRRNETPFPPILLENSLISTKESKVLEKQQEGDKVLKEIGSENDVFIRLTHIPKIDLV